MNSEKLRLRKMGVINITPDSFSDSGELKTSLDIKERFESFGKIHALDIGAESTAPQNRPISQIEEWGRWQIILPTLSDYKLTISADTYHPETIFQLVKFWKDHKLIHNLFWNDVSGKFDHAVKDYLKEGDRFHYIYCHNRAPRRELAGKHMDYVSKEDGKMEEELRDFFCPYKNDKVIFDPCLGFSKTYDESWFILEHFPSFQRSIKHDRWLLGFSRKSFLRKKFQTEDRNELDRIHGEVLEKNITGATGELWIRTHRPELL